MSGDARALAEKREAEVTRMGELLEDWKEILVQVKRVVDWEEPFHPAVLFGVVSLLFLVLWVVEPTFLSFVSLFFLILTLADYALPYVVPRLFPADAWNEDLQDCYNTICASVVGFKYETRSFFFRLQQAKAERPGLYLALTSIALLFLAWIGSCLGDFTLLYLLAVGLALYPGAVKNPAIAAHVNGVVEKVKGLLSKEKAN